MGLSCIVQVLRGKGQLPHLSSLSPLELLFREQDGLDVLMGLLSRYMCQLSDAQCPGSFKLQRYAL